MSEAKQLKKLFEETRREMAKLKPWQKTNRVPLRPKYNTDLIFRWVRIIGDDPQVYQVVSTEGDTHLNLAADGRIPINIHMARVEIVE